MFLSCATWVSPEYPKSTCPNALWLHAYNPGIQVLDVNKAKADQASDREQGQ